MVQCTNVECLPSQIVSGQEGLWTRESVEEGKDSQPLANRRNDFWVKESPVQSPESPLVLRNILPAWCKTVQREVFWGHCCLSLLSWGKDQLRT